MGEARLVIGLARSRASTKIRNPKSEMRKKSEARNPNTEIRNPKEVRNSKSEVRKKSEARSPRKRHVSDGCWWAWSSRPPPDVRSVNSELGTRNSDFFRISDFGFRISLGHFLHIAPKMRLSSLASRQSPRASCAKPSSA